MPPPDFDPDPDTDTDPDTGLSVEVVDARGLLPRADRSRLAAVAARTLRAEGVSHAEVSIAVVDDPTIREVNRRHLGHDWATDVVTFPLSGPGDPVLSGEVVVSAETADRSGSRDGVDPRTELILYVVHGLLHLVGLDDRTEAGASAMRRREGAHLARHGLSHPFSPTVADADAADVPPREAAPCSA